MRVLQALFSAALISASCSHSVERRESSEKRVVCYYTNWSVYRPGTAKYNPQNINPYLCTHLIYAFGGLDRENGLRPYDKYQDIEQGGYAKFTGLKSYNKNLKTMLAIGGWNEGSARFSPLVADDERRTEFVKNVVKFLRVNHFDGLDLDWEYPAFRDGGKPRDRDNYAQLVQELREEFDREHDKTGRPRLLLTMAVPAGIEYIDKGYDVPKLNRYLDFMNILSYDYHSAFEPAVNHHSPLFPLEEDNEYNFDAQLSIDYTVKHYLKAGADRDKLVLGIPTYGRSYTLFNPESTDIGAPADGPGEQGDATREKGYLAYYEICGALKGQDDWTVVQPKPRAMGPYAYRENQWVGYDDVDIVKEKANYVNDQGLGGIMFWSIDNDDFRGKCHDRAYPLIEAAKEALYASSAPINNNLVSSSNKKEKTSSLLGNRRPPKLTKPKPVRTTSTTPAPSRTTAGLTTPEPPTTPDPGSDFVCKDEGFFPHPRDCKKYFWCLDSGPSNLGIVAHQFTCPSGLFFNKAADSCDYTRNVLCNKKERESKSTTIAPKVTAATSKTTAGRVFTTTTTTTTTTTEAPEEEVYEEEEEHEQEDPESIKQLIQLIKKLGGVAELEKQLEGAGASGVSTPAIPRSLYNKVLTPQRPQYKSPFRNGPSGPQNEGLSQKDDGASYRREKPQYVTIRRERPSTEAPEEEKVEIVTPSSRSKYTNIVRSRPVSQYEVEEPEEEDREEIIARPVATSPRYQTIERSRPARPEPETEEEEEETFRPRYSTIQRSRPSTIEAIVENTTPRYVTLRRERPQVEQQQEESTIKHAGETIVIEAEEEIKPIEIDVEEPITTTVRPKIKVSEVPWFGVNRTTNEPVYTTQVDFTSEVPLTLSTGQSTTASVITERVSVAKESETESSSLQPTTVPYQTSTLTSIVTVVVEGATERKRVPLTKLKQALADHDLLANSVAGDKKYVSGKSSVPTKDKTDGSDDDKTSETNKYRPLGNYRGRPRKPIVVEPPTTKALPLYLQRRRTTTTTEKTVDDFSPTEESQLTTKSRTIGRFTPSRTRDRTRRPSSTLSTVTEEVDAFTPRTNRYRTSRPSTNGSRFISSRGRGRSTTESPDTENSSEERNNFENKDDTTSESTLGRRRFGNRKESNSENSEKVSEKPTRLFSRGKTRSTTEKPLINENSSTTRSRFVLNRGRNRATGSTTQKSVINEVTENDTDNINQSTPSVIGGSRFQIQRRRKYKNETDNSLSILRSNKDNVTRNKDEEEHEIMISQDNSVLNPSQIVNISITTPDTQTENVELTTSFNPVINESEFENVKENISDAPQTNDTTTEQGVVQLNTLQTNSNKLGLFDEIDQTNVDLKVETVNNESITLKTNNNSLKIKDDNLNHAESSSTTPVLKSDLKENNKFDDYEAEGEVLDVIASRYSEQSFTGKRGSTRFQGSAKHEEQEKNENVIADSNKKNNSRQTRRKKGNTITTDKEENSVSNKPLDESNNSSKRRKVLVRKNKVTSATKESLDSTTENLRRDQSRSRSSRVRANNTPRSRNLAENNTSVQVNSPRSRNSRTRQKTENIDKAEVHLEQELQKINPNTVGTEQINQDNNRRRKVKVLKSRHQVVNSLEGDTNSNVNGSKRRVKMVVKKKIIDGENIQEIIPRQVSRRRGPNRFSEKDLRDLDTGTSLFVQRETESEDVSRNSFTRSVNKQTFQNALVKDVTPRGKIRAKESLLDDITGVTEGEEDYNVDGTDVTEAGGTRVRPGFRRPASPSSSRSRLSTTTEPAVAEPDRPVTKFYRRRVNKVRASPRNTTPYTSSTASPQGLFETTVKQRRYEFPRRSGKPTVNTNTLPQQSALVATTAPFVEINDNHSDESLHEVDTETVESKEVYEGLEDSTLPDLANVAVAAIQSLATAPPSTETLPPATSPPPRRQVARLTTTTTTTTRPPVNSRRGPPRPFSKVRPTTPAPSRSQYISKHKPYDDLAPEYDDYYAEPVDVPLSGKVRIHNDGYIECLDIGNFPHPFACKKFISCAKMENGHLLGWEYTCPKGLSFDPIGGICNWSAGLGCKE